MTTDSAALPCPECGCWAIESMEVEGRRIAGYRWHCFGDGGVDCEFTGPVKKTSAESLAAWNALPRAPT